MRTLLLGLTNLLFFTLAAQQGDFLLTDHFPLSSNLDNTNFEIINDSKGRLCIANRGGVLKYDGESWDFFETPSAVLSLAVDDQDIIYAGCIGSVGYIDFHKRSVKYRPLLEGEQLDDLFLETHHFQGRVFFLGSKKLVIFDTKEKTSEIIEGEYANIYELGGRLFINTIDAKTYEVKDTLEEVASEKLVAYTDKKNDSPDLVVDFDGVIHTYEDDVFQRLPQNKFIEENGYEVEEIIWINDSLFTCSTFQGGILFFNKNQPEYMEVTDYNSGLHDHEIYALHSDNLNGVWAAHEFGISHISPLFPAYSYSHFPGLHGNLTGLSIFEDRLWVTSSQGIYHFDEDTIFETQVYYEVVEVASSANKKGEKERKTAAKKKADKQEKQAKRSETSDKKPFLKRLFRKKNRATQDQSAQKTKDNAQVSKAADGQDKKRGGLFKSIAKAFESERKKVDKITGKSLKNTKYVRKKRKVPVDIHYDFEKIAGANGKFTSLVKYQGRLLGVGSSGIYEIRDAGAELILQENVRSYLVDSNGHLLVSTADLHVKSYRLENDIWIEQFSEGIEDIIVSFSEAEKGMVWMAGTSNIYKASVSDSTLNITNQYALSNQFLDDVSIIRRDTVLYFINSQGYFYFDGTEEKVLEDDQLEKQIGMPVSHIFDTEGESVWIFTGKFWYQLDKEGAVVRHDYLGLFPGLVAISTDPSTHHLWLVTQENQLLQYDPKETGDLRHNTFFVKKVSNDKGDIDQTQKFVLAYDENHLSVEISKPDFLGFSNPEFQYKLVGLHEEWSEWSKSKTIDFSYLPEGEYRLLIRSRDAFDRVEENEALSFEVKPPYWKTTWFYAIQMMVFVGLVYYASHLNQNNSKNRLLSGGLTILTLVLVIEFLQSAISSLIDVKSTPVVDFLLDVLVALFIFPLERLLRELMTKGKVSMKVKVKKTSETSSA